MKPHRPEVDLLVAGQGFRYPVTRLDERWRIEDDQVKGFAPAVALSQLVEGVGDAKDAAIRSEEHTSELQSQSNIVCRLLLEKKKIKDQTPSLTRRCPARLRRTPPHSCHTPETTRNGNLPGGTNPTTSFWHHDRAPPSPPASS